MVHHFFLIESTACCTAHIGWCKQRQKREGVVQNDVEVMVPLFSPPPSRALWVSSSAGTSTPSAPATYLRALKVQIGHAIGLQAPLSMRQPWSPGGAGHTAFVLAGRGGMRTSHRSKGSPVKPESRLPREPGRRLSAEDATLVPPHDRVAADVVRVRGARGLVGSGQVLEPQFRHSAAQERTNQRAAQFRLHAGAR